MIRGPARWMDGVGAYADLLEDARPDKQCALVTSEGASGTCFAGPHTHAGTSDWRSEVGGRLHMCGIV